MLSEKLDKISSWNNRKKNPNVSIKGDGAKLFAKLKKNKDDIHNLSEVN